MANHKLDPEVFAHLEWIGFVKPTGLVVSAPALVRAGAILDRRDAEGQHLLRARVEERVFTSNTDPALYIPDFRMFAETVLGWSFSPKGYAGTKESPIPSELEVPLPDYGETLRPDFAVRELEPQNDAKPWQLVVRVLLTGEDMDRVVRGEGQLEASPHGRMERLLRQTGVRAGLLFNGQVIRLISAPHGESSGWVDFRVADMVQTGGRPICTALRLLLSQERLLALPRHQRLTALLDDSRKFQNEVSERLAEQVLHALYELLRGFQSAHDASKGELLRAQLAEHPDEIYRGLLTVILRLVFLLYAEERDMLPEDETFIRYYSLASLYERLREDAALHPDTMDQRFGAWAQLIVLFRMMYDGAEFGTLKLPKRHGSLFDPNRFPFLEGRANGAEHDPQTRINPPLVPDGTIYRAFEKLLVLDGERISYRALDVEQIGSVYQTMMGFRLETATGRSIAIKAAKKYGAPTTIDLEALLAEAGSKREKWMQDRADRKLTDKVKKAVKEAETLEDLHAALLPVLDLAATPDLVPPGALVLQPSEERRRSGSHYTPRELTAPIVKTTLEPILARLRGEDGKPPRPEQILDLKVCDPAMGSGAFLVEACRQLGDALVDSWRFYGEMPAIPADEDETIFARRLVAQRCIYGVDRNPMAVDLAKVSLWLVTLAKDHPFTFLDHALRHGDSLVGLSLQQLEAFRWDQETKVSERAFETMRVRQHIERVSLLRQQIRLADETVADEQLQILWNAVETELSRVRLFGDLVISAYFEHDEPKKRLQRRNEYANAVVNGQAEYFRKQIEDRRYAEKPLAPFHWELEFPEVFERKDSGFDAFIGNPPFAGKNTMADANVEEYLDWLKHIHKESHGNSDIVAHFFRRTFDLVRDKGTLGLIATNTIAQGDTRSTGLRWLCKHSGEIYQVRRRVRWPGLAAVIVSVVHIIKGEHHNVNLLDSRRVNKITAFLFHRGEHDDPIRLIANADKSFQGSIVLGMGFTFDDTDKDKVATPLNEMYELIKKNPKNQEVIYPYIGGEEVNNSPTHSHHRYAISFFDRKEEDCRLYWPDLMGIIEKKVRPEREVQNRKALRERWWQYAEKRPGLYKAIEDLQRVLVINCGAGPHASFAFLPANMIFANTLAVIAHDNYGAFCALQSRPHEVWARLFGSTMKDDLRYTPTDCFETFPFPEYWGTNPKLEFAGKEYYEFRATLMVRNDEGLTATYNRFHNPEERDPEILKLRELHSTMDHAVLEAYGWHDIPTACDFFLDYEIDEEEWGDKKKPYRYRWPDEVRDEVLARLLELNAERAKAEAVESEAKAAEEAKNKPAKSGKGRKKKPEGMEKMF
ncbi:MAG: N-6 DNA methylase [Anaerolineae bacterium]|nr:N-6 DNA methylase [Anaerolineae bacterium]